MVVGAQHHAPAALPPVKTRYPLYRRLGGPQGRSGRVRKISPPPGFDPRTVQPSASSYTDWDSPAAFTRYRAMVIICTAVFNVQFRCPSRNALNSFWTSPVRTWVRTPTLFYVYSWFSSVHSAHQIRPLPLPCTLIPIHYSQVIAMVTKTRLAHVT